jgi:hypothetical protein
MNFKPRSQGTRITLVTSPGHHPLSSFLVKCNHVVGKNNAGEKMPPRAKLAWSGRGRGEPT